MYIIHHAQLIAQEGLTIFNVNPASATSITPAECIVANIRGIVNYRVGGEN